MATAWFETVAEAQRRAKKRLPKSVYSALLAGSERGTSYDDNTRAFAELGFAPHVAGLSAKREMSTRVLGQDISMPVVISPTGVQAVHPDGEVAVARAAAARGLAMGLSSFASKPLEAVVEANPQTFFQTYWMGGRDAMVERLARARDGGAVGLIVTLDWSFSHGRDWGSPSIPEKLDLKAMAKFAPEVLRRPRWLYDFARSGDLPDLTTPNLVPPRKPGRPHVLRCVRRVDDDAASLLGRRGLAPGAVGRTGHAQGHLPGRRRAGSPATPGVTAISVSNHGGNNLDGTPAPIRTLPPIAEAVGDDVEVLLDGGIRRGSDVVKAVALGAKAVLIGRAYLWGLAANGQAGVENVLDILRGGIDSALLGMGHSSIHDLGPDDIVIPDGFTRALGVTGSA